MGLGIRMWRLWRLRAGVVISAVIALLAAAWSIEKPSFFPPGLTPRSLEMAAASTHVVVDTPTSTILDLRQDTYSIAGLTNRAVVLGNVMADGPVRESIARRARVPVGVLQVAPPLTPEQPQARVGPDQQRRTSDILKSTDQYRLSIEANPTVPVLDIYAQTPTVESAEALANAAVDALRAYLTGLAQSARTPRGQQVRLVQLGRARGALINQGLDWEVALLAFLITFGVSCATVIFLDRVKRGWRLAASSEQLAGG
jgi:hypothetical protein